MKTTFQSFLYSKKLPLEKIRKLLKSKSLFNSLFHYSSFIVPLTIPLTILLLVSLPIVLLLAAIAGHGFATDHVFLLFSQIALRGEIKCNYVKRATQTEGTKSPSTKTFCGQTPFFFTGQAETTRDFLSRSLILFVHLAPVKKKREKKMVFCILPLLFFYLFLFIFSPLFVLLQLSLFMLWRSTACRFFFDCFSGFMFCASSANTH